MDNRIRMFLHMINRQRISDYATDFWACSEDAAKWFYKEDLQSKAVIIKNAIELDRVGFSEEKREVIRNKYGISDGKVKIEVETILCKKMIWKVCFFEILKGKVKSGDFHLYKI